MELADKMKIQSLAQALQHPTPGVQEIINYLHTHSCPPSAPAAEAKQPDKALRNSGAQAAEKS